jgi:hypothetical protein
LHLARLYNTSSAETDPLPALFSWKLKLKAAWCFLVAYGGEQIINKGILQLLGIEIGKGLDLPL